MNPKVILIDVDGTITFSKNSKYHNIFHSLASKMGFLDELREYFESSIESMMNPLDGVPPKYLRSHEFLNGMLEGLTKKLFEDACENVGIREGLTDFYINLKKRNFEVIIISDSVENFVVDYLTKKFGNFYDLAFVRLHIKFDENGRYAGIVDNFRGLPKDEFINDYINQNNLNISAYVVGDSFVDLRFLIYPWVQRLLIINSPLVRYNARNNPKVEILNENISLMEIANRILELEKELYKI